MSENDDMQTSADSVQERTTPPMTRSPTPDNISGQADLPPRPRREEFFIHPDILRGTATYRTLSSHPRPARPDDDTATSAH